jgi:Uma2 family endonuclease
MVAAQDLDSLMSRARPLRRSDFETLAAAGAFDDERVELVRGVVLSRSPIDPPHADTVDRLMELLVQVLGARARVRVQSSFSASDHSAPQPDLAVVPRESYATAHPSRAHLIIEVADSSLRFDRKVKAGVYAEAGVPDYWIVNLVDGQIEVHREPTATGYGAMTIHRRGERIALLAFPDVTIAVDDVVPA